MLIRGFDTFQPRQLPSPEPFWIVMDFPPMMSLALGRKLGELEAAEKKGRTRNLFTNAKPSRFPPDNHKTALRLQWEPSPRAYLHAPSAMAFLLSPVEVASCSFSPALGSTLCNVLPSHFR